MFLIQVAKNQSTLFTFALMWMEQLRLQLKTD